MSNRIAAAFEDSTGTIQRLTGELDLEVPATSGQVLTADGSGGLSFADNAANGVEGYWTGNAVTIANGSTGALTFDTLGEGTALLDTTTPDAPAFVSAGTYAVTIVVSGPVLTAAGYALAAISSTDFFAPVSFTLYPAATWSVAGTLVAAEGDPLLVNVTNHDGTASRAFTLEQAIVVKL